MVMVLGGLTRILEEELFLSLLQDLALASHTALTHQLVGKSVDIMGLVESLH